MRRILLLLLVCLNIAVQAGESKTYKWFQGKEEVGKLEISKEIEGEKTIFKYESRITIDVGEVVTIQDVVNNEYLSDSLVAAGVSRHFNGKPRIIITEEMTGEKSSRTINGTAKNIDRAVEVFSYLKLFIEAPKYVVGVYYEIYGKSFLVKQASENTYVLVGPNNRTETFVYNEKGQLTSAEIETNFGTFKLVK